MQFIHHQSNWQRNIMRRSRLLSIDFTLCASLSHVCCSALCCVVNIIEPPIADHQSAATSLDYDANSPRITCDFGRFHIHMHTIYASLFVCTIALMGKHRKYFLKVLLCAGVKSQDVCIEEHLNARGWELEGTYIWIHFYLFIVCRYIALCRVDLYSRVLNCPAQNSIPGSG